jgi:DNA transformation protein
MDLNQLPNIDEKLSEKLQKAGIKDAEKLKIMGAEKAFLLLKEVDVKADLNQLYILEAAIEEIPVAKLSKSKKEELEMFFHLCE